MLRAIKVRGNPPFCHLEIPAGKSTKLLMSVQIFICVLCMLAGKFIAIGTSDFHEFRQRHVEIGAIFLDDLLGEFSLKVSAKIRTQEDIYAFARFFKPMMGQKTSNWYMV